MSNKIENDILEKFTAFLQGMKFKKIPELIETKSPLVFFELGEWYYEKANNNELLRGKHKIGIEVHEPETGIHRLDGCVDRLERIMDEAIEIEKNSVVIN